MKILLAASEVAPIIKMGGLGDVAGALPKALEKLDVDVDVIVPYFEFAKTEGLTVYKNFEMNVAFDGQVHLVSVFRTKIPGSNVDVILLQNSKYFHNYGSTWKLTNEEETELFSFFDRCVVEYVKTTFNTYDLIHCNDWHTGLVTHLLSDELQETRPATLFTIHNLMYQGISKPDIVRELGIVPGEHLTIDMDISDGDLNMIQQGIESADFINTVSPTYMQEILTYEYGHELSDVLQARIGRTEGILNGIDYSSLPRDYDVSNVDEAKGKYKQELLKELNLEQDAARPLFGFVGRLDPYQKGIDILFDAIASIVDKGGTFVLLGSGDSTWEDKLKALSNDEKLRKYVSVNIKFDNELSHRIYAASDFLLVPSRYEPCGLIQMIAMWYGSLPIVRATGGLKDSVKEGHDGFLFNEYSTQSLIESVDRAFSAYREQRMSNMRKTAMTKDFSWDKSAKLYKELYQKVIQLRAEAY